MITKELRESLRIYIAENYSEIEDKCVEYEANSEITKDLNQNFSKKEIFSLEE